MKCVTICNPYPYLILHEPLRPKRIENRTWPTSFRGDVLVHAGLSVEWMSAAYSFCSGARIVLPAREMLAWGAIVGVVRIVDCVSVEVARVRFPAQGLWISGPWCWVLDRCAAFSRPIKRSGAMGLFNVPVEIGSELYEQLAGIGRLPAPEELPSVAQGGLFGAPQGGGRML